MGTFFSGAGGGVRGGGGEGVGVVDCCCWLVLFFVCVEMTVCLYGRRSFFFPSSFSFLLKIIEIRDVGVQENKSKQHKWLNSHIVLSSRY